jgi:aminomethyltransferase
VGKIDLQGPASGIVLRRILSAAEDVFAGMVYFSFKGGFDSLSGETGNVQIVDGTPVLLSRTGYTGEFGFEIFLSPDRVTALWEMLLQAGEDFGLIPCGLAARDSLRTGAVLPLSHQDIGPWPFVRNPWTFALPCGADGSTFTKDFIGRQALETAGDAPYTYPFVGNDLRKVSTADAAEVFDETGSPLGTVLSCATDVGIGREAGRLFSIASPDAPDDFRPRGLSCGFVKVGAELHPGDVIQLRDSRRAIEATVTADIRPDRTARRPIKSMIQEQEEVLS